MKRAVLVICDGHRADFVRPDLCPAIVDFSARARAFVNHRAIFPSATRASSASIATGCWPARHGLHGNSMGLPQAEGPVVFDVGDPAFTGHMRAALGRTLKAPTLAQRLADVGGVIIASNVSPGAAYFQDPDHFGHVYHRAGSFGPGGEVLSGDRGLKVSHDAAGDEAMTRWFCEDVLSRQRPRLGVLWLANPDLAMHADELGSPTHLAGLAAADRCVAQVEATVARLRAEGDDILLLIGSDHGQETVADAIGVEALLVEAGFKQSLTSCDICVAPQGSSGLLYASDAAADRLPAIADWLRAQPWIGGVFVGEAMRDIGQAPGDHLAIAFSMRRSDAPNAFGVAGETDVCVSEAKPGKPKGFGTHGGLGRYECHPFLMISGGGFAPGSVETAPSRLIDIAPTILRFLDLPHDDMDGKPLANC